MAAGGSGEPGPAPFCRVRMRRRLVRRNDQVAQIGVGGGLQGDPPLPSFAREQGSKGW
jgi:hypothetical protein